MNRNQIKVLKRGQGQEALRALNEGFKLTITPVKKGLSISWVAPNDTILVLVTSLFPDHQPSQSSTLKHTFLSVYTELPLAKVLQLLTNS